MKLKRGMIIEVKYSKIEHCNAIVLRAGRERIDLWKIETFFPLNLQVSFIDTSANCQPVHFAAYEKIGPSIINAACIARAIVGVQPLFNPTQLNDFLQQHWKKKKAPDENLFFVRRRTAFKFLGQLTREEMLTHDSASVRLAAANRYRPIKENPYWFTSMIRNKGLFEK